MLVLSLRMHQKTVIWRHPEYRPVSSGSASNEEKRRDMLAGARKAEPILNKFIDDQLIKYGLKEDKLALIGFSQGTMMSLFVATRRKTKIAGVVGFSGQLVGKEELVTEITSCPPVVLVNGDQDELIPVQQQQIAVEQLGAVGIEVKGHIRPNLGHSIDAEGIKIGCDFLEKYLLRYTHRF